MKYSFLQSLLVVSAVSSALVFSQSMQGQILLPMQDANVEILKEGTDEAPYGIMAAPLRETSEQTSSCFDLTKLGEKLVIRCFNHNVQMDTLSKNPLKISIHWDGGFGEDRSGMAHPRQTLMSSTTQKDDIVPSLSVIPTNGQYSIRCGADSYGVNDLTAKGSSTGFYQTVQQANPVLMIISAAILEKTDHTIAKQGPAEAEQAQTRIKMYAVDLTTGVYLDCPSLEYLPYTNPNSVKGGKWKTYTGEGRDFYWKDWDTTYLDMSSYVGHQLVFFYETYDCNVSGMTKSKIDGKTDSIVLCTKHETARLYVTMDCAPKPSVSQICKGAKTELVVPAGWSGYKWKKGNNYIPGETSNTCLVSATEGATYTCELKSLCTTTKITSTVTPLTDIVNKSIIQGGSVEIDGHTYTEAGNESKTWTHIRHTDDNTCDVVVTVKLTVQGANITQECEGDNIILTAPTGMKSYQWMNTHKDIIPGATSNQYTVSDLQSDGSARYICSMKGVNDELIELDAIVYSNHHTFTHVINEGEEYDFFGRKLKTKGQYTHTLTGQSYLGCDSIIVLNLVVKKAETEGCFDMTDIENGNITLMNVDFGSLGGNQEGWKTPIASPYNHPRQTLITTAGTDALIPALSVLPPSKQTSFRLASDAYQTGEWPKGSEMNLSYIVEQESPIVYIQYACVLEDPQHNPASTLYQLESNPWIELTLSIAGQEGQILMHNPSTTSSVTGSDWHSVASDASGNRAYWKDWGYVALDLSAKVGQKITITIRQRDCAVESVTATSVNKCGKHKSHVYAYLGCAPKKILQTCDNNGVTLTAPEGCQYQWYKNGVKMNGETKRTLTVGYPESDKKETYSCKLSDIIATSPIELTSVVYSNKHSYEKTIEFGEEYDFYGEKLSVSDTYTKVVPGKPTYLGCDSIEVLTLSVTEGCEGTAKMQQDTLCGDAENMTVILNYTMGSPKNYQLKFSEEAKTAGFEDVTTPIDLQGETKIVIPFRHQPNAQMVDGKDYPRPGNYQVTITEGTSCGNSLTHTLNFTILYPSSIIVQRWNDVLAITNSTYNGGYNFSRIRWYHEGQEIAGNGEHNSYYYVKGDDSQTLAMGTEYWAELTREGESTGICTCHFIPEHKEGAATRTTLANVEVQSVARRDGTRRLELITEESGTYSLYDVCGRAIQSGYFGKEYGIMEISVPTTGNIFIMKFVTNSGQQDSKKLMVY